MVFNREMSDVIDIMKKIAISQFQTLFNKRKQMAGQERYLSLVEKLLDGIDFEKVKHPLFNNPLKNVLCILITTEMGFLGGLNTNIIEDAMKSIKPRENAIFLVVGEKGRDYLDEMNKRFDVLPAISDEIDIKEADRIAKYIFAVAIKEKIGKVIVSYPKFFSFAHQEVETMQLLPRQIQTQQDLETLSTKQKNIVFGKVIYEPFLDKVVNYLIRNWLLQRIYDICWNSKLSEFAARATHLEGSIKELEDMRKNITFQYFRNKHEVTDRTIRDIFGGKLVANRLKLKKNISNQ
jgi:ATP synthase F1 gamma subunit